MERAEDTRANGGFPEPPAAEPVRVVSARHRECGASTRVRLPRMLAASTVRRVRCSGCAAAYEADEVEEVTGEPLPAPQTPSRPAARRPALRLPSLRLPALRLPTIELPAFPWRAWRWVSIPLGAAAVIGALLLIQGGEEAPQSASEPSQLETAIAPAPAPADAQLVRGRDFALALPAGWERDPNPPGDARFAAAPIDGGGADATLWVRQAPGLDFASFEGQSLDQLRALAGSAEVTERVSAPTPEGTIVRLAADAPPDEPQFEVTLRIAGPYRYYLATTLEPGASREAAAGVELIHGSFTPQIGEGG